MRWISHSEADTEGIGETVGGLLGRGVVLGLVGPLGAGKTAFVRGVARACGVEERLVQSPTFITAARYPGRVPVAHLDLYRHQGSSLDRDWLAEILEDEEAITLVEWFERLGGAPLPDGLLVEIGYAEAGEGPAAEDLRVVSIAPLGPQGGEIVARLAAGTLG